MAQGHYLFVKILIDFVVVIGVAVAFWWLIERPLIQWARGIWKFGRSVRSGLAVVAAE